MFARWVFPDPFSPKIFNHFPGQFGQSSISLKAGKYVFEGRRAGFKTVLVEKFIALDEKKVNLEIVCNEPI